MAIIRYDFGKKRRDVARGFRKRVNLDEAHESRVLANPLPYLERAEQRLFELEEALRGAAQALTPQASDDDGNDTVVLSRSEHDRLLAAKAIILKAVAKL